MRDMPVQTLERKGISQGQKVIYHGQAIKNEDESEVPRGARRASSDSA